MPPVDSSSIRDGGHSTDDALLVIYLRKLAHELELGKAQQVKIIELEESINRLNQALDNVQRYSPPPPPPPPPPLQVAHTPLGGSFSAQIRVPTTPSFPQPALPTHIAKPSSSTKTSSFSAKIRPPSSPKTPASGRPTRTTPVTRSAPVTNPPFLSTSREGSLFEPSVFHVENSLSVRSRRQKDERVQQLLSKVTPQSRPREPQSLRIKL